jgi:hypothetical protein
MWYISVRKRKRKLELQSHSWKLHLTRTMDLSNMSEWQFQHQLFDQPIADWTEISATPLNPHDEII